MAQGDIKETAFTSEPCGCSWTTELREGRELPVTYDVRLCIQHALTQIAQGWQQLIRSIVELEAKSETGEHEYANLVDRVEKLEQPGREEA